MNVVKVVFFLLKQYPKGQYASCSGF